MDHSDLSRVRWRDFATRAHAGRRRALSLGALALAAVAALVSPLAADAQYGPAPPGSSSAADAPAANVNANGNAFTGGLSFAPAQVSIKVGDTVRWINTDAAVPHTATEAHGLWDLAGSYGATPANPSGFAPGASVQRAFEAGTQAYYCRVHPQQMRGVIAVPVQLALRRTSAARAVISRRARARRHRRRRRRRHVPHRPAHRPAKAPVQPSAVVHAVWASAAPSEGLAFDVERRQGSGPWERVATATQQPSGDYSAGAKGTIWSFRARLRSVTDAARATDWSPLATITG